MGGERHGCCGINAPDNTLAAPVPMNERIRGFVWRVQADDEIHETERGILYSSRVPWTDRNGCQKSLGDVGDDDSDEKDDSVEPEVAEDEGDDEEGDAEEDGDSGDDMNEVSDLTSDRRLHRLQPARQYRDPAHHCPIAGVDDHAAARTCPADQWL